MARAREGSLTLAVVGRSGVWLGGGRRPTLPGMLALILLLTASFTLAVDFSILNVALPEIGRDVGLPLEHLQWVATAFALSAAGLTLLMGRVADLFGRRRMFLAGIALLGASSLAGGLAESPGVLIGARALQGVATAIVTPAALSLLTTTFPEGPRRDRALGLNGALMAAGFTTGAILGGVLTDALSWRWAFFINVLVAAVVLAAGPRVLRESRSPARLDVPGAVAVTFALLAIVYGITGAGPGWVGAGLALLIVFRLIEQRTAHPLVPLDVLRRPSVAWGNLAGVVAFATETALVFLLTLYLQEVLGYSPLEAGLAFAVLGAGTVLGGLLGPRAIAATSARTAVAGGLLAQAAATAPLVLLGPEPGWIALVLAAAFLGGVANLVAIVGFMVAATSGLPDGEQGLATGLATMSQQVGITLGIPLLSAIATSRTAVLSGVTLAIAVDAAVCAAVAVVLYAALGASRKPVTA